MVCFVLLGEPVQRLTALYSGDYRLEALGPLASVFLLSGGSLLGLLGSWLSVGRQLAAIEPS
jgi:cell division transport system permease protein